MPNLIYLGMTLRNQFWIHDEMKNRLISENAFYYSVQNHVSSLLLFENVEMYKCIQNYNFRYRFACL
jgi:hypothetical protein